MRRNTIPGYYLLNPEHISFKRVGNRKLCIFEVSNIKSLLKIPLLIIGSISTILGIIGALIPVLPTTPFLLLAAVCFFNSSARLYEWLTKNKYFGSYIKNFREGRGIPLRIKIYALSMLWISMGFSVIFAIDSLAARILLLIIAVVVTAYIISVKAREDIVNAD